MRRLFASCFGAIATVCVLCGPGSAQERPECNWAQQPTVTFSGTIVDSKQNTMDGAKWWWFQIDQTDGDCLVGELSLNEGAPLPPGCVVGADLRATAKVRLPGFADELTDISCQLPVMGDWAESAEACDKEGHFFRISREPETDIYTVRGPGLICMLLDVWKDQEVFEFRASCGQSETQKLRDFKDQTIRIKVSGDMSMNLGGKDYSLLDCND